MKKIMMRILALLVAAMTVFGLASCGTTSSGNSASDGGDKVKWIEDMFTDLKKYPEIKAAVWFNSCDWDPDYPKETVVSRQYRLDENQATIDAFKNGVKDYKHDSLLK